MQHISTRETKETGKTFSEKSTKNNVKKQDIAQFKLQNQQCSFNQ